MFVERGCFDIGQPDASFTGGLGEFMRVAAMLAQRGPQDRHPRLGRRRLADAEHPLRLRLRRTPSSWKSPPAFGPLHREIIGDSLRDAGRLRAAAGRRRAWASC